MSTELEEFIEMKKLQKRPLTESTMKKYIKFYEVLSSHLEGKKICECSEEDLITVIDKFDIGSCGKLNYQNIAIMVKDQHKQETEKLKKYKELLSAKKDLDTQYKSIQKLSSLPPYNEVRNYIDSLYEQGDYSNYLVNELIFSYGLRNVDVNVILATLAQYKQEKKNNLENYNKQNWLVLKKNSCDLVINRYKTKNSYGSKNIEVKLKKVLIAGNALGSGWLIQNTKNQPVDDSNVHNYMKLMQYDDYQLRQSDYFKINLLHIQSQPNSLHKINMLSKSRGSQSLDTLDKHYNMHPKEENQEEN
jgi:hypothetical protein